MVSPAGIADRHKNLLVRSCRPAFRGSGYPSHGGRRGRAQVLKSPTNTFVHWIGHRPGGLLVPLEVSGSAKKSTHDGVAQNRNRYRRLADWEGFVKTFQPMGQIPEVKDIVDAVLYLAEAGQVTGEVLHVGGGAHVGKW